MYVMASLESKLLTCISFHTFCTTNALPYGFSHMVHSPTCIVCGYQLADSEVFQVLVVKGHRGFWADLYAFSKGILRAGS